jgi:hypothetical protein
MSEISPSDRRFGLGTLLILCSIIICALRPQMIVVGIPVFLAGTLRVILSDRPDALKVLVIMLGLGIGLLVMLVFSD